MKKLFIKFSTAIFIIFLLSDLSASQEILLHKNFSFKSITSKLHFLEDKNNSLKFDDIKKTNKAWKIRKHHTINLGYSDSAYWFKFSIDIKEPVKSGLLLEIANPILDHLEFYKPLNNKYDLIKTGDREDFNSREIFHRNFIFQLANTKGKHTYYFKVRSKQIIYVIASLNSWKSFHKKQQNEMSILWMFVGIMMILGLYNLFIYFSIRDIEYIYYVLFIVFFTTARIIVKGVVHQYLENNYGCLIKDAYLFIFMITFLWLALFIRSYLKTYVNFPIINKLIIYTIIIPMAVGSIPTLFIPINKLVIYSSTFSLYYTIFFFVISLYGMIKKSKEAKFLFFTLIALFTSMIIFLLAINNIITLKILPHWGAEIGVTIMAVFLSYGLASRINSMRLDLIELTDNLEINVSQRTNELVDTMKKLQIANNTIEKSRDSLLGEVELARTIQLALVPENPEIEGFKISAYMQPAKEVGGDYYDVINHDEADWILIGDVSGHGLNAGLVMMMVQSSIHTCLNKSHTINPSELIQLLRMSIIPNLESMNQYKFMTISAIRINKDNTATISGRHLNHFIYKAQSNIVEKIKPMGTFISPFFLGQKDIDITIDIEKEDVLLLYTDGIIEAMDEYNNFFSEDRLQNILEEHSSKSPEEIKDIILRELQSFIIDDDVTIVIAKKIS